MKNNDFWKDYDKVKESMNEAFEIFEENKDFILYNNNKETMNNIKEKHDEALELFDKLIEKYDIKKGD